MAYEPKTWQCGEVVSADALNHIEQGIADASEGGGCDCGYECTEVPTEVFNGSLTTELMGSLYGVQFTPSQPIEGDSIVVTLNGTDYTLPKTTTSLGDMYGEADSNSNPVFTNYPCAVAVSNGMIYFFTPSEGTYQVAITAGTTLQAEVTECFKQAVSKVAGKEYVVTVQYDSDNETATADKTFEEVKAAYENGSTIVFQIVKSFEQHGVTFSNIYREYAMVDAQNGSVNAFYANTFWAIVNATTDAVIIDQINMIATTYNQSGISVTRSSRTFD